MPDVMLTGTFGKIQRRNLAATLLGQSTATASFGAGHFFQQGRQQVQNFGQDIDLQQIRRGTILTNLSDIILFRYFK